MTSQKRYRHQDNSNSSTRSKEVPPRFKRQKSTSEQTSLASQSPPPTSNSNVNTTAEMTKLSTPQCAVGNTRPSYNDMAQRPLNNSHYVKYTDVPSGPMQPQSVDYNPQSSGQMWPVSGYPVYPAQPVMLGPGSVLVPGASAMLYNNENCAPSPPYNCVSASGPVSPWSVSGYGSPYHSSCSSPAPSPLPAHAHITQIPPDNISDSSAKSTHDPTISDTDLRTIEMLRELERVADEKESQEAAEKSGSDRKTLVSHHLRMIMCAMDLYTEGIEDDVSTTRGSDNAPSQHGSNSSSPAASPSPSKTYSQQKTQPRIDHQQTSTMRKFNAEQLHQSRPRPVLGASANTNVTSMMDERRPQVPQAMAGNIMQQKFSLNHIPPNWMPNQAPPVQLPMQYEQPAWRHPHVPEWNIWSSPSFEFFDVLGSMPPGSGHCQSFESFQDSVFPVDKTARKPLYKR